MRGTLSGLGKRGKPETVARFGFHHEGREGHGGGSKGVLFKTGLTGLAGFTGFLPQKSCHPRNPVNPVHFSGSVAINRIRQGLVLPSPPGLYLLRGPRFPALKRWAIFTAFPFGTRCVEQPDKQGRFSEVCRGGCGQDGELNSNAVDLPLAFACGCCIE